MSDLSATLRRIDGKSYKAYKDIAGSYRFDGFSLLIDHVQGDPFGSPSRLRLRLDPDTAGFPEALWRGRSRSVALRDYLARVFSAEARKVSQPRGSGSSGLIAMDAPGQQVLERSAVMLLPGGGVEARFVVGLPARGRSIDGRAAEAMLLRDVPRLTGDALRFQALDAAAVQKHVETVEDADALRGQLDAQALVAFVADGAILPRLSGVDDRPMSGDSVPFESPESLRVELDRPNAGPICGLGVRRGVTLIVGGGYHGKSTLLRAIERGVYNHRPGDGRECVVADAAAVKARAEDGRSTARVDISPFINDLPGGVDTTDFSTPNASGSTSQAANIVEALEAGARVLMMDEDTSATNFMIRDRRMQALIAKSHEPITPFIDKVPQLYGELGVSTVLVIGGSGDYLDVADSVIAMEAFRPQEVTAKAREIAARFRTEREAEGGESFGKPRPRSLRTIGVSGRDGAPPKVKVPHLHTIRLGNETIDLSAVEQLVDESQTRAIARALLRLDRGGGKRGKRLTTLLDELDEALEREGLDALGKRKEGDLARVRRFELAAALNRLRSVAMTQERGPA